MAFDNVASKMQEELADIIRTGSEVSEYELIVYKYLFKSELEIPVFEDLGVEMEDDSFILYVIPDNLEFALLRKLDDAFDMFKLSFLPNSYNILKLRFKLEE